jgi:hypothetical protein
MRSMRPILLAAGVIAVAASTACGNERSITTEPVGNLGFGTIFARVTTNLPRGTVTFPVGIVASATPATDSVIITLAGLDSLATGSYTVWFANDSATKFARAGAVNMVATRRDSSLNAAGDPVFTNTTFPVTGAASFRNGGANISLRIAASRISATPAMPATDSLTVVIVSIEAGAPGAAPGEVRPLWARRSQANASRVSSLRFGTFGRGIPLVAGNPGANQEFVVATNGAMTIVPRGRVEVRGAIMILNDSNYFRPPVGYYYNAYGIKLDTTGKFTGTTYLGRRTAPYPDRGISLYEADKSNPAPAVVFDSPRVIFAMASRLSADTIPDAKGTPAWRNYGFVRVNLQAKAGIEGRMGPGQILEAVLPPSVRGR